MPPKKSKVVGRLGRPRAPKTGRTINFRFLRKIFLLVLSSVTLGGFFYFVFLSSYFEIKEVNISGLKSVSEEGVKGAISNVFNERKLIFAKLNNYFLFSADLAMAEIQSVFPKIGEVKIKKVYPEIINIEILERDIAGVWCHQDICFYFDKTGVIFEPAPKSFGGLMISVEDQRDLDSFKPGDMILSAEQVSFLEEARELIGKNFPFYIKNFIITPQNEIEILTSENWRILLSKKDPFEYQLSNLKYLLDEEIKERRKELAYVDLRLGNRVYYKYKLLDVVNEN